MGAAGALAAALMGQPLVDILDLSQIDADLFEGLSPQTGGRRIFGGLVVAQALVAVSRTVSGRAPHSLHAYFVLPGDPSVPISYAVVRIRDGKSFSTRRCMASQHGRPIFEMLASFHAEEAGFSHQAAMPDVKLPDELPSEAELAERFSSVIPENIRRFLTQERLIELRLTDPSRYLGARKAALQSQGQNIWVRAKARLPDDLQIHRAVLAYLSDMTLIDATMVPHGRTVFDPSLQVASLDHALWFHQPFRADEWLLYCQDSPTASGARGLARGLFFSRAGVLVASVIQEGLIRQRR